MRDVTRTLQAYLDGELAPAEAEAVRRELARDPAWRRRLAALQELWGVVDQADAPRLEASLWPDLASRLPVRRPAPTWTWSQRGLAAAALAAGVLLGLELGDRPAGTDVAAADGGRTTDYLQDGVPTLDQLWFQLGETDEDVES